MDAELLVTRALGETRVALLEDGTTQEVFFEQDHERSVVGNIYRGRVTRVLPGMEAAFVDVGLHKAAFLHVDDIFDPDAPILAPRDEEADPDEEGSTPPAEVPRPPIQKLIQQGQELTVQVTKSPLGTKGARVTTYITLPGRAVVFMPTIGRYGVSRKIQNEDERKRLKTIMEEEHKDEPGGFIARTACVGLPAEEIARDMGFLRSLWSDIHQRSLKAKAPSLVQSDLDLVLRATRDLFTESVSSLWVDDIEDHNRIKALLERFAPNLKSRIQVHNGIEPLFEQRGVEDAIEQGLSRTVPLISGGSIIVDEAEALTAIDINTGSFVGHQDLEKTIVRTNLEACKEVAHQIRLRNLGGIIIVDFIDMQEPEHRENVYEAFVEAISKDRAKTHILPMTEFGLVELTRKRVRPSIGRTLTDPCPYCEGRGWLRSRKAICQAILRDLMRRKGTDIGRGLLVSAMPDVASELTGPFQAQLETVETELGLPVVVEARVDLHQERFEVTVRR